MGFKGATNLRGQLRRLIGRSKELRRLLPLGLLNLLVVEEAHCGASPEDPVTVVLVTTYQHKSTRQHNIDSKRTSFFVTGLSSSTRWVNRANLPSTSRSDSSVKLFDARTKFLRFGMAVGSAGWMTDTRLRASSSVRIRGDSGKLPSTWMSLSVKSMQSWGCR